MPFSFGVSSPVLLEPYTGHHSTDYRGRPPLILHIPHASSHIPFLDGYVYQVKMDREIALLTDWHTDELFHNERDLKVMAHFSRVFCDVERFREDETEPMSKKGMGLAYSHCDDGSLLREVDAQLRDRILREYYDPHHRQLTDTVDSHLSTYGEARIIDCHSYPEIPFQRDIDQSVPRPDFNIGTLPFHTPPEWIDLSVSYFDGMGFSLGIDRPYAGSIVPIKHLGQSSGVHSIMLEVNRRSYLRPGTNEQSDSFGKVQQVVSGWLDLIYQQG